MSRPNRPDRFLNRCLLGIGCCVLTVPAAAQESPPATSEALPPAVEAMLREAKREERRTVINVAKRMYPASVESIDRLVTRIQQDEKAEVTRADFIEGFTGELSAGGFITTGNTDEWGITGSIAMERRAEKWVHILDARVDIKEESGERTEERVYGNYTLRRNFPGSKWFAFVGVRFEHDEFQGISRRFGEAAGPGYQLVDSKAIKWDILGGPVLRQTNFVNEPSENTIGLFGRTRFSWEFTDTLRFSQNLDMALDGENNSFAATSAITSDVYGNFSLRLSYTVEIETDPPEGREKTETYTRASLIYEF